MRMTVTRGAMAGLMVLASVLAVRPVGAQISSHSAGATRSFRNIVGSDSSETRRLRRIEMLADIWAKLELYHPALQARKDIDWDSAFLRALPRVEKAGSTEEFVHVINEELFSPLADPLSYARTEAEAERRDSADVPARGLVQRLEDRVAYVDARDPMAFDRCDNEACRQNRSDGYARAIAEALRHDTEQNGPPSALIVDLRWQTKGNYSAPWLRLWADTVRATGVLVSRLHRGHTTPTAWQVQPTIALTPFTPADSLSTVNTPTVFLVNLPAADALQVELDALQRRAGIAMVLERSGPIAESWDVLTYPESIRVELQSPMLVSTDGGLGLRADQVLDHHLLPSSLLTVARNALEASKARPARPRFTFPFRDLPRYPVDTNPLPRDRRILGLVRVWKELSNFDAYREYASVNLKELLPIWIPQVEAAKSAGDYLYTLRRLVALLNDTHANVIHASVNVLPWTVPFLARRFGDHVLVTLVDSTAARAGISVGDEIIAVDGLGVQAIEDSIHRARSESNLANLARDTWDGSIAFRGARDTPVRLSIRGSSGSRDVILKRSVALSELRARWDSISSQQGLVRRMNGNIGYIDLYRTAGTAALDSALTLLAGTDGLVLDARRGGPTWQDGDIRQHLVSRFFTEPVVEPLGGMTQTFMHGGPPTHTTENQELTTRVPFRNERNVRYLKPLAILISARDQSYGESAIWLFRWGHRATFVGERTAGTNGGAPDFSIPSGALVIFTHERITKPDGSRYHGIGIDPDVPVTSTAEGLRAGRDEVLEKAVEVLIHSSAPLLIAQPHPGRL